MKQIFFLILISFFFVSCDSKKEPDEKSISDALLQDIWHGDVSIAEGYNKRGIKILKVQDNVANGDDRFTNRLKEHIFASGWKLLNDENYYYNDPRILNIPKEITRFEFLDKSSSIDSMFFIESISKNRYDSTGYLQDIYKNFKDFKNGTISIANKYGKVEINDTLNLIRYKKPIETKTYNYNVVTNINVEEVSIRLYKIDKSWKIGLVTKKDRL